MRGSRPPCNEDAGDTPVAPAPTVRGSVDLGLALSIYGKREDGSLIEIGDPASPLARQPVTGTWPSEQ